MKLSRYNIEKKEDKSCLIYNTVTSAILELDTDYEKSYYEMKEGKKCSKPDLESALLEGGMLVEDDKDEFAELLIRNKIERFADSNLTLTIAPTMACNFCCPYCYEKGREYPLLLYLEKKSKSSSGKHLHLGIIPHTQVNPE